MVTAGYQQDYVVPLWVVLACALALAAGTYRWLADHANPRQANLSVAARARFRRRSDRLERALAHRFRYCGTHLHHPGHDSVSDGRRRHAADQGVRWRVAREIGMAWVLTLPAAATIAALAYPLSMLLTPG